MLKFRGKNLSSITQKDIGKTDFKAVIKWEIKSCVATVCYPLTTELLIFRPEKHTVLYIAEIYTYLYDCPSLFPRR